jgi:hypothetical protein
LSDPDGAAWARASLGAAIAIVTIAATAASIDEASKLRRV